MRESSAIGRLDRSVVITTDLKSCFDSIVDCIIESKKAAND
jgi:hypothetical protein